MRDVKTYFCPMHPTGAHCYQLQQPQATDGEEKTVKSWNNKLPELQDHHAGSLLLPPAAPAVHQT